MSLSAFTPRTATAAVENVGIAEDLVLVNTLFRKRNTHATKTIDIPELIDTAKLAPAVHADAPAVPVDWLTGALKTFTPPCLKPMKVLDENKASVINPGIGRYTGPYTDPNAQIMEKVVREWRDLRDRIERTNEVWAATMLSTGSLTITLADGSSTALTLSVGYTGNGVLVGDSYTIQPALSGTAKWDQAGSDPLDDLRRLARQIRQYSNYGGRLTVLLGWQAAKAFLGNDIVREYLDTRRIDVGNMTLAERMNVIAQLGDVTVKEYTPAYETQASTSSTKVIASPFAANRIVMAPADDTEIMSIEFGAIYERPNGNLNEMPQFLETEFFAVTEQKTNPPVVNLILQSKPFPLVKKPSAIRVLDVVTLV